MKGNVFFSWVFMFSACAMIAIGRVYDDRLELLGVNIALIISVVFFLSSALLIVSLKRVTITKSKFLLYIFYFLFIVLTPILWLVYGAIEYGVLKYFNFFIVIFMSVVIIEKFNYKDVEKLLFLFLAVSSVVLVSSFV